MDKRDQGRTSLEEDIECSLAQPSFYVSRQTEKFLCGSGWPSKNLSIEGGGQIHKTLSLRGVLSHLSSVVYSGTVSLQHPSLFGSYGNLPPTSPFLQYLCGMLSQDTVLGYASCDQWDPKQSIS